MSDFSISFVPNPPSRIGYDPETEAVGKVLFGDFEEHFTAWLGFWKQENYEGQWSEGLARVLAGLPSCLITNINRPDCAREEYIMRAWLLYPVGELAVVHEKLFFADQLEADFCATQPYEHVPDRKSLSDDGEEISEWRIELAAIRQFLNHLPGWA